MLGPFTCIKLAPAHVLQKSHVKQCPPKVATISMMMLALVVILMMAHRHLVLLPAGSNRCSRKQRMMLRPDSHCCFPQAVTDFPADSH
jgi:hypothetical protein